MADTKISNLPIKPAPYDTDIIPIVDDSDDTTKKATLLSLYDYIEDRLKGPEFTRDGDGNITNILYDDGSYKVLTYSAGKLVQLDLFLQGVTTIKRKTFIYSGDTLLRIDLNII